MITAPQQKEQTAWAIRAYRDSDLGAIVALANYVHKADGLPIFFTEDEQRVAFERPGVDPENHALIVEGRLDGVQPRMLLGWGVVQMAEDLEQSERAYTAALFVHPLAREQGLHFVLADRLVEIVHDDQAGGKYSPVEHVIIKADVPDKQPYLRGAWEQRGLALARQFWTMECPLDRLDEPAFVDGVALRPYNVPGDNAAAMDAFNQSFCDHYGFHATTPERWSYRMNQPYIRPDLSCVAAIDEEPGRLAGFCMCAVYTEENKAFGRCEGWIDLLGTVRGWRGRGLGRALLLCGMHSLRSAGMDTAVLGVDSLSPTNANRLYESVGFRLRSIWLHYEGELA